ncbi:hypothetical protein PAMP_016890 [Pampus punctatissimus]
MTLVTGEGRCCSAAFSKQLSRISSCCLLWEKISEEENGMDGARGEEEPGEDAQDEEKDGRKEGVNGEKRRH